MEPETGVKAKIGTLPAGPGQSQAARMGGTIAVHFRFEISSGNCPAIFLYLILGNVMYLFRSVNGILKAGGQSGCERF